MNFFAISLQALPWSQKAESMHRLGLALHLVNLPIVEVEYGLCSIFRSGVNKDLIQVRFPHESCRQIDCVAEHSVFSTSLSANDPTPTLASGHTHSALQALIFQSVA
jgi:hypothetical protein